MTVQNGDIIRVTCKLAHNSGVDDIQNVYHYKAVLGTPASDLLIHNTIAANMELAYTEINTRIPNTTTYTTIESWNVTQDAPMVEAAWPTLTAGTGTGEFMPAQCAPLCLFSTATARSQGRKYLPFLREADMNGGILSAATLADIADMIAILLAVLDPGDGNLYIGNWRKTPARFAQWVAGEVQSIVRTQRRRVRGVGS